MSAALERSRVVPAGTAILLKITVAQDLAEALAADAAVKVQLVARFSIGFAAGAAYAADRIEA